MLVALVLEAPVSTVATSTGATSTSAPSINIVRKILNLKEFTLFCREFENVVNRAFLVLIVRKHLTMFKIEKLKVKVVLA